jgi:hypothetical protein
MIMITFKTLPEYYEFFEAIPEDKWCVGKFKNEQGQMCAVGHVAGPLGDWFTRSHPIRSKMSIKGDIRNHGTYDAANINNGSGEMADLGETPKERVLNAIVLIESGILKDTKCKKYLKN